MGGYREGKKFLIRALPSILSVSRSSSRTEISIELEFEASIEDKPKILEVVTEQRSAQISLRPCLFISLLILN